MPLAVRRRFLLSAGRSTNVLRLQRVKHVRLSFSRAMDWARGTGRMTTTIPGPNALQFFPPYGHLKSFGNNTHPCTIDGNYRKYPSCYYRHHTSHVRTGLSNFAPQADRIIRNDSPQSRTCVHKYQKERLVHCVLPES
jgi:hypothetical protein